MTAQSNGRGNQSHGSSLLEGKLAVVFGAGGSIGGAVAKEFAAEGAEVFFPVAPSRTSERYRSRS